MKKIYQFFPFLFSKKVDGLQIDKALLSQYSEVIYQTTSGSFGILDPLTKIKIETGFESLPDLFMFVALQDKNCLLALN